MILPEPSPSPGYVAAEAHDHQACVHQALRQAELLCASRGLRFTPLRRRVLELVWAEHEAVKAYDLIRRLSTGSHHVKPPTVYRALDFLLAQGLVHRVESLNAFVGCVNPGRSHACQFIVCDRCGWIGELTLPEVSSALRAAARARGFAAGPQTVEVHGLCRRCLVSEPDRTPGDDGESGDGGECPE